MISVRILVGVGYIGTIYVKRYIQYQNACEALDKEEYLTAYRNFTELDDFMESDEKLTECIYSWVDYVLSSGDKSNAYTLSYNVSLNTKFYRKVYN